MVSSLPLIHDLFISFTKFFAFYAEAVVNLQPACPLSSPLSSISASNLLIGCELAVILAQIVEPKILMQLAYSFSKTRGMGTRSPWSHDKDSRKSGGLTKRATHQCHSILLGFFRFFDFFQFFPLTWHYWTSRNRPKSKRPNVGLQTLKCMLGKILKTM